MRASLALLVLAAAAARGEEHGRYDRHPNLDGVISGFMAEARAAKKPVLIEIGTNDCRWGRALDSLFTNDKEIANTLEKGQGYDRAKVAEFLGKWAAPGAAPPPPEAPSALIPEIPDAPPPRSRRRACPP